MTWEAQPGPQRFMISCPIFEIFFGGARGGGKTDGMLGDWLSHAAEYGEHAIGLMVRRQRTELIEAIERSKQIYLPLGHTFNEQTKMWTFTNGARLRFAYLERDSDAEAYQGHSYTRVYVEEIGNFPNPAPIMKLMATLRSGAGVPVGFRATGNPGGPGHGWVRERYIDPAPTGFKVLAEPYTNPFNKLTITRERVFIPSRVTDNAYLGADYIANLQMAGSETLVRAWLEGDWSVIDGAFFDIEPRRHFYRPFEIPDDWARFRSMDWGSASPFSIGWWAVVGDDFVAKNTFGNKRTLPRGCIVRYREWYGWTGQANKGLKLDAEAVADGIREREADDLHNGRIMTGVLDPAAFAHDGGPSIAERMSARGVSFNPADNKRVGVRGAMGGWDIMRSRLKGFDDRPMLVVFDTCTQFIRTVPMQQHDPDRPEDIDTDGEDHVADEVRYACMSRPWVAPSKIITPTLSDYGRGRAKRSAPGSWMAA